MKTNVCHNEQLDLFLGSVGWFNSLEDSFAAYNPSKQTGRCLACEKIIIEPIVGIPIICRSGEYPRLYFYQVHYECVQYLLDKRFYDVKAYKLITQFAVDNASQA